MSTEDASQGVSNCYVFKSRLQEYAQKTGLSTPVYETIREGPSHEPTFRSTVIVNDVRYDSLPGFFNRKAAEQSAAEVALTKMAQSGAMKESISPPVHETGLCKNLLQEYAQKMNFAMPLYECRKDETPGRGNLFSCTVEIGGIRYIGASARTKKEAEIKAARTALLAIQSAASDANNDTGNMEFTVLPSKKKPTNLGLSVQATATSVKPKKRRFKKKPRKCPTNGMSHVNGKNTKSLNANQDMQARIEMNQFDPRSTPVTVTGYPLAEATNNCQYGNENKENLLSNNGGSKDGNSTSPFVDQNLLRHSV